MEKSEIGSGNSFAIGPIIVEPSRNILRHDSEIYPLEPKIMDVLEHLAIHQGKVLSRDEIIAAVWNVEFGADESLTRAISVIRKTFRKAGGRGRYIQTISKRGYFLQEPISKIEISEPEPAIFVERPITKHVERSLVKEAEAPTTPLVKHERKETLILESPRKQTTKKLGIIAALTLASAVGILIWQSQPPSVQFGNELAVSQYGRSVAVMPFVDLSADKNNQYFSDGIAEELSSELGKINSLRIAGHRLGGAIDHSNLSYEEVGDKLKVSHVIHGSVRKQGERVRITAQLINTEDNSHAWSSNYDGTLEDVFELQQRVAYDIVTELSLVLSLEMTEPIDLGGILPTSLAPESK